MLHFKSNLPNSKVICLIILVAFSVFVSGQQSQIPVISLHGGSLQIDGRYAHIKGKLPVKSGKWLYSVETRNNDLYVYHLWLIQIFADTKESNSGHYEARSWTVEVLDTNTNPEQEVVFERRNSFFFSGNLMAGPNTARLTITAIDGLPDSSSGPITLQILT